jgi:hypothetical protein
MESPWWVNLSQAFENVSTGVAILLGGLWAVIRFRLLRTDQTALAIKMTPTIVKYSDALYLVFLDVACQNKGSVRLVASNRRPAFDDDSAANGEVIQYSLDLQLRGIRGHLGQGQVLDWWDKGSEQWDAPGYECDLAEDYEDPKTKVTDFWLEPGERYHLSTTMLLPSGAYLAKVTFVGDGDPRELWRRSFLVKVPAEVA